MEGKKEDSTASVLVSTFMGLDWVVGALVGSPTTCDQAVGAVPLSLCKISSCLSLVVYTFMELIDGVLEVKLLCSFSTFQVLAVCNAQCGKAALCEATQH